MASGGREREGLVDYPGQGRLLRGVTIVGCYAAVQSFITCRPVPHATNSFTILRESIVWEPGKASQNENEYFARQDAEWLRTNRAKLDADRLSRDQAGTSMACPRCGGKLGERTYHDVRIDVCADCRGVWLDKGELHMLAHVKANDMLHVIHDIETGTG